MLNSWHWLALKILLRLLLILFSPLLSVLRLIILLIFITLLDRRIDIILLKTDRLLYLLLRLTQMIFFFLFISCLLLLADFNDILSYDISFLLLIFRIRLLLFLNVGIFLLGCKNLLAMCIHLLLLGINHLLMWLLLVV